jgi:hypothetical protein
MTDDRDLHTLGTRSYEWRQGQDDDASDATDRKLEALRGAVRNLAQRVARLEAAVDARDKSTDQPPPRACLAKSPPPKRQQGRPRPTSRAPAGEKLTRFRKW